MLSEGSYEHLFQGIFYYVQALKEVIVKPITNAVFEITLCLLFIGYVHLCNRPPDSKRVLLN